MVYFLTCLALYADTEQTRERAQSYFNPVLQSVPEVKPMAMGAFAGALDYSKLNMVVRMIMKTKMEKQGIPEGDFRDFHKIEFWAGNTVFPILTAV